LNFTTVLPTQKALKDFVTMIRSVYQHLTDVVNGKIGFGDGTNHDNIDGSWINVVAPAAPNTDFTVTHNLGRIPVGYWLMQKDRACDVYTGSVAATKTQLTLRATVASAVLRLFVIGLLFGFFATQSSAQGFAITGTAMKNTPPPGNLGISGTISQAIPSAVISVCPGSISPILGTVCSPVTSSLFSDVGLTVSISNPTNADLNGNFAFFVTAAQGYVVSVSGTGVTTYSYVVSAPLITAISSGANTALSNLSAVNINTSLLPQTGVDLGSAAKQFRNLYLFGSGTYGVNYFIDTGVPTGVRTQSKQDVTDVYVYRTTTDTLTNKTFSLTANTLNSAVNTVGHFPRNNGTQYLDSALLSTDLPATTANCSGNNFAQGLNAGGTPICTSAGVSEATFGWGVQNFSLVNSQTCDIAAVLICVKTVFAKNHTLVRFTYVIQTAAVGCGTNAVIGVRDITSTTTLASSTVSGAVGFVDSGAISASIPAGDTIGVGPITQPAGCGTFPIVLGLTAVFQ
jgi:hypothetical protein